MPECPIDDCTISIESFNLMCLGHWRQVPTLMRSAVNTAYRAWTHGSIGLEQLRDVQNNAIHYVNVARAKANERAGRRPKSEPPAGTVTTTPSLPW